MKLAVISFADLLFGDHGFGCQFCKFSAQLFPSIIELGPLQGSGLVSIYLL